MFHFFCLLIYLYTFSGTFSFDEFARFALFHGVRLSAQRRALRRAQRTRRAQSPFGAALPPNVLARSAILYRTAVLRRLRPHICELRADGDFYAYSQRVSKFALFERRRLPLAFSRVVVDGAARGFKVATSTFVFPPALCDAQRAGWIDALRRAGYEERDAEKVSVLLCTVTFTRILLTV